MLHKGSLTSRGPFRSTTYATALWLARRMIGDTSPSPSDSSRRNQTKSRKRQNRSGSEFIVDTAAERRDLDVESHFHRAMEHIKSPPTSHELHEDIRVARHRDDAVTHNMDGLPKLNDRTESAVRSFFDEGGVDIRGSSDISGPRQKKNRDANDTSREILSLSGTTDKRFHLDRDDSAEGNISGAVAASSSSPSDPTLVQEPEGAYGDTPVQLTDMLRERLMELKAEKLSDDRNQTFLKKRVECEREPAAQRSSILMEGKRTTPPTLLSLVDDCGPETNTDDAQQRIAAASKFLQQADDLLPGVGAFDPFSQNVKGVHRATSGDERPDESSAEIFGQRISDTSSVLLLRTLQRASLCSRREAVELIATGEVRVNGVVERNPFRRITASDDINVRGHPQRLRFSPSRLWLYHKPANVVVSRHDPAGRGLFTKHALALGIDHLIPVGSLPFKAHGALLLTNDGELARFLEHPNAMIQKTYNLRVKPAIDPVLAHKLNTEGLRINGILYQNAEFLVNHAARSRFHVKVKIRGDSIPVHHLMAHLGRHVQRGGRESFGPFTLHGLAPGTIREVTLPPFYAKQLAEVWKPFVERDWPYYRRQRVIKLRTLAKYRELHSKELEELDAFTFDELRDALSYESSELEKEAKRVSSLMETQPHVDDTPISVFSAHGQDSQEEEEEEVQPHPFSTGSGVINESVFVEDITKV